MEEIKSVLHGQLSVAGRILKRGKRITHFQPADSEFSIFTTTVWSVPKRGKWATHASDYRGNWAPQIARNLILRYSDEGDLVLDQMVGGGTTLIECKLTGRNGIGIDINPDAIAITRDRLAFGDNSRLDDRKGLAGIPPYKDRLGKERPTPKTSQKTFLGDARNLDKIKDASVDFVATHPPYANIIEYGEKMIEGDLSNVRNIKEFCREMRKVAEESFRVLKPGKFCAILIGDTRRHKHFVPITPRVMDEFLEAGFVLKESIIKRQWNCMTTGFWSTKSVKENFLLIMHEHIYVFRKPDTKEKTNFYKDSMVH
jgi:DNA modification methylase